MKDIDRRQLIIMSLVGLSSSTLLTACAGVGSGSLAQLAPKFSVAGVRLLGLGLAGLTVGVDLDALNQAPVALPLSAVNLDLDLAGVKIGRGSLNQAVTLSPNAPTRVPLTVSSDILSLGLNAQRLLSASSVPYGVSGKASVAGIPIPIPFARRGSLQLR